MIIPDDLQRSAHRSGYEYAWQRADALAVVEHLVAADLAILGGEVWLVGRGGLLAIIPQREGAPAVEHWTCERHLEEPWLSYVARSAAEARIAIQQIPDFSSAQIPTDYTVHYNLTWEPDAVAEIDAV